MTVIQNLSDDFVRAAALFIVEDFNDMATWYNIDKDLKIIGSRYIDRGDINDFGLYVAPTDAHDYSKGVTVSIVVKVSSHNGFTAFDITIDDRDATSTYNNTIKSKTINPQSDYDRAMGII